MKAIREFFAAVLLLSGSASHAEGQRKALVLVTGQATTVRLVRVNADGTHVLAPSTFSVVLKDVKVVQGDSTRFPRVVRVSLDSLHSETLKNSDRVFVLFDNSGGQPKVLFWNVVHQFGCVPDSMIDPRYQDDYFRYKWQDDPERRCTVLDVYRAPREPEGATK